MNFKPAVITTAASSGYACLLRQLQQSNDVKVSIKVVSSLHAVATTAAVLYALYRPWPIDAKRDIQSSLVAPQHVLDDRYNPMIRGNSELGNDITAWETGYLLYDTAALLTLPRKEPVMLLHHGLLLGALGYLQIYITRHQERGIWIIAAFLLMNASNPLLHLRWWRRKCTGKQDLRIDFLFAAVFAGCRFGTLYYVLKKYGMFHQLSGWTAFWRQRAVCKIGTTSILLLNAAWWLRLVASMFRSTSAKVQASRKFS